MPSARAISPRSRSTSASRLPSTRGRSGRTTAAKMRRSSSEPSSTSTPLRRKICAASWTRSSASASSANRSSGSGHGETMSRALRSGSCVQISSVTCGSIGCRSPSSRSRAMSAVAASVLVVLVETRLDRLGVPVAEVVERQVVEDVRRRREVESAPGVLELRAGGVDAGEDPALLEIARTCVRPRAGLRSGGSVARRSRACSRACGPPRSCRTRSGRPGSTRS